MEHLILTLILSLLTACKIGTVDVPSGQMKKLQRQVIWSGSHRARKLQRPILLDGLFL